VIVDTENPIRFPTIVRIVCFGSAPVLWTMVPVAGAIIAPIAMVGTLAVALSEVYRTSFARALTVAIFPKIAFILVFLAGIAAFSWVAFRMLAALFGIA